MSPTNITREDHLTEVLAAYDNSPNPRLAEITRALVRHLHEFVAEVGLTREEWFTGIEALTKTGHMCDDERAEFVLMSDTLGVSMLVEMLNHGDAGGTEPTVFGPFHLDGAPDLDGHPIGGAELDVWETASNGSYDVQDDNQSEMNMRGVYTTADDGRFEIVATRPVDYTIPSDGPAGALLVNNGRHNWRPAHFHFVVSAPGYHSVMTHLFDGESAYLDTDAVFGVRDSLVVDMSDGTCEFDFVLAADAASDGGA